MRDPGVIDALDALERYSRALDAISRNRMLNGRAASCDGSGLETTAPDRRTRAAEAGG